MSSPDTWKMCVTCDFEVDTSRANGDYCPNCFSPPCPNCGQFVSKRGRGGHTRSPYCKAHTAEKNMLDSGFIRANWPLHGWLSHTEKVVFKSARTQHGKDYDGLTEIRKETWVLPETQRLCSQLQNAGVGWDAELNGKILDAISHSEENKELVLTTLQLCQDAEMAYAMLLDDLRHKEDNDAS